MNLYFDCKMGAAGDMIASALVELFDDRQKILDELNAIGIPHTRIIYETKEQNGVSGAHLKIIINGETETPDSPHVHEHSHRILNDVYAIINTLNVSHTVSANITEIYSLIAAAEAKAHSVDVGAVHFHELGMLDAIADITICAYIIDKLNPESVISSAINVGNGTVHCAHGELPVPAPATANILNGMLYYKSDSQTELCTPTGAALLKHYVTEFTDTPNIGAEIKIGIGCGTKQLTEPNVIRIIEFTTPEPDEDNGETVTELSCNIDDMT